MVGSLRLMRAQADRPSAATLNATNLKYLTSRERIR
jgi:hypothetical protein